MTQHTPGALQAVGGVIREHLPSGEKAIVATDVGNYASFVTAAELVRRWNTHEVMLKALKQMVEFVETFDSFNVAHPAERTRLTRAKAAIAAAEGPGDTQRLTTGIR